MSELVLTPESTQTRALTVAEFQGLGDVPAEAEWFVNIRNDKTRRAYRHDVTEFAAFLGLRTPEDFRAVVRAHVIAWRDTLETRHLAPAAIRRKLSSLLSLYKYLCDANALVLNAVLGVERPPADSNEGATPALSDAQVRALLAAQPDDTRKGRRDRAILSTLLFHGLRREELCKLRVGDIQSREGTQHFLLRGKRGKTRYVPVHLGAQRLIERYLDEAGHGEDRAGAQFRSVSETPPASQAAG